jgi:hypothetical protein
MQVLDRREGGHVTAARAARWHVQRSVDAGGSEGGLSGLSFWVFLGFERAPFLRRTDFHARRALWLRPRGIRILVVVGDRHIWCRGHGACSSLTRCKSSDDVVTMSRTDIPAEARLVVSDMSLVVAQLSDAGLVITAARNRDLDLTYDHVTGRSTPK